MKNIKTSALTLCVLILVAVCGFAFSTGVTWIKYDYASNFDDYRCVPNETVFLAYGINQFGCCKKCHLTDQCLSVSYQTDQHLCIGCRVHSFGALLLADRYEELPGSMQFSESLMTSCKDVLIQDRTAPDGVYEITIGDDKQKVYCDMTTDGGGWTTLDLDGQVRLKIISYEDTLNFVSSKTNIAKETSKEERFEYIQVFQNRFDGSVEFYRNFTEYENGFGDMNGEFWLGLRYIQILADKYPSEFKMVITGANDVVGWEHYKSFRLANGNDYTLFANGASVDSAMTEGLEKTQICLVDYSNGRPFSTFDRNMDVSPLECFATTRGAWWFKDCTCVNLNGFYCTPGSVIPCGDHSRRGRYTGIWHMSFYTSLESLKKTRMMIRPVQKQ